MFSCELCEIFKSTFFIEPLWWLLPCDFHRIFFVSTFLENIQISGIVISKYLKNSAEKCVDRFLGNVFGCIEPIKSSHWIIFWLSFCYDTKLRTVLTISYGERQCSILRAGQNLQTIFFRRNYWNYS